MPRFGLNFLAALTSIILPALANAQAAGGRQPSVFESLVPFLLMAVLFYFVLFRPQRKRQQQHQEFLAKLKRGDEVITSGGLLGTVEGLTDLFVTLEISPGVRIKILRAQVASFVPTAQAAAEVKA